ncbi:MAG: glycosyltransferase family 2 protein, partial [Thermoanaerobaculia bacterium]
VVDNDSSGDDLARLEAALPGVRILPAGTNLGFGGGNNLALRELATGCALLLNPDAGLAEADAERLLAELESDPRIAVTGPLLTDPTGRVEAVGGRDIGRHARTHRRPEEAVAPDAPPIEVDYVPGTAALLRLDAVRAVGGFDERFFFSGEMADLCRRLREAGWRCVVVPGARAWHRRADRDAARRDLDAYYSLRNRFLFVRKHGAPGRRWWWAARGTVSALRHLVTGRPARARAEMRAVLHGLRGRFGPASGDDAR